jgi:hypothetical protein
MVLVEVERRCRHCGAELPSTGRRDRRYCSAAHRQAAYERRRGRVVSNEYVAQRSTKVEPRDPVLAELEAAVERATEEQRLVAHVARAAAENWRAASWLRLRESKRRRKSEHEQPPDEKPTRPLIAQGQRSSRVRARGDSASTMRSAMPPTPRGRERWVRIDA